MYCTNCGKQISDDANYCSFCGVKKASVSIITKEIETNNDSHSEREKLVYPEKSDAKLVIKKINSLLRDSENVVRDFKNQYPLVQQAYQELKEETIQKALVKIPIERLNDAGQGLRLGVIKNSGIVNIAQLNNSSIAQLMAIRGVGEQTAYQAKSAAANVERSMRNSINVRIDPDQSTPRSTKLVRLLYIIKHASSEFSACNAFINQYRVKLITEIKQIKPALNKLRWLLSSASKKQNTITVLDGITEFSGSDTVNKTIQHVANYKSILSVNYQMIWNDFATYSPEYYSLIEAITGVNQDTQKIKGDLPEDLISKVEAFELDLTLLKVSLRGYQEFGAKYALTQRHTLIGDEMGLGKTVQAIAALSHLKREGSKYFLVVSPASVLINWNREVIKHSHLKPINIHGYNRDSSMSLWAEDGGVAISTYETIKLVKPPQTIKIDMLIVDEAHYAKNHSAQRTKAVQQLVKRSEYVLFLTGTPLENRLDEMKSLIGHLQPKIASEINTMSLLVDAQEFRHKVAPVYLRRNREDVLNELPDLIEMEEWVGFGPEEENLYRNAVAEGKFMFMRRAAWMGNCPETSPKLNRLIEICEDGKENNRRIVIFSFFRTVISHISQALGERCLEPITGSVTPNRRQQIIDDFSKSPSGTVLICQIQAGGVGLNIQAASIVILCEPQIKPALETQAISRAYRMGQVHKVVVHRLLTENSIDERMIEMLGTKQQIFNTYARESDVANSSLQAKDITERSLIDKIVADEQERYGMQIRGSIVEEEHIDG